MAAGQITTKSKLKPFAESMGGRQGYFASSADATEGGSPVSQTTSPVTAATQIVYIPASAKAMYIHNAGTGITTINAYDSADNALAGAFVLGAGGFITIPLGGSGDSSNRYPVKIKIIAAASTTASYMFDVMQPNGTAT